MEREEILNIKWRDKNEISMMEFKGTSGKWYADIRSGCCVVYPVNRKDDTNGLNPNDDRNIYYSDKDAFYDNGYWTMCEESQANALLISKAPEMLKMLQSIIFLQKENYGDGVETHLALLDKVKEIKQLIKEATSL